MTQKNIVKTFAALFLCLSLCSCSSEIPDAPVTESGAVMTSEAAVTDLPAPVVLSEKNEPSEFPVTVNGTIISAAPQRVVCLSQSLTEMIFEIGAGERIIGRGSYCDYPPAAASLPDAGRPTAPDMQTILALSPELLITATAIPEKDRVALSEKGISVLYIPAPRTFDELGRIYTGLAEAFYGLFSCESIANDAFSGTRAAFEESNISFGSFIYITEGFSAAGGDTFESSVLSFFGENLAENEQGYVTGTDFLGGAQPDTVIMNSVYSLPELSESVFGQLDAVRAGKVIIIDNSYFENPSCRLSELEKELHKQTDISGEENELSQTSTL